MSDVILPCSLNVSDMHSGAPKTGRPVGLNFLPKTSKVPVCVPDTLTVHQTLNISAFSQIFIPLIMQGFADPQNQHNPETVVTCVSTTVDAFNTTAQDKIIPSSTNSTNRFPIAAAPERSDGISGQHSVDVRGNSEEHIWTVLDWGVELVYQCEQIIA